MYLYIDTTDRDSFTIALIEKGVIEGKKTVLSSRKHSEKLLASIQKMLLYHKTKLQNIKGIAAVRGPGSFTSLRIGIASANALGFALDIPVVGVDKKMNMQEIANSLKELFCIKKIKPIIPEYGREPDIT